MKKPPQSETLIRITYSKHTIERNFAMRREAILPDREARERYAELRLSGPLNMLDDQDEPYWATGVIWEAA